VIVDANILLYATDRSSRFHAAARDWLEQGLNGLSWVGFPWQSLIAFLRIATHPRAVTEPLTAADAWRQVEKWLAADVAWVPLPTERHQEVLGGLITANDIRGNLVADAHLAALAIEHGVGVCSADSDFARFPEVRWINPVATGGAAT
jgi:uncharacterized protein